jgi:hypothetical protein
MSDDTKSTPETNAATEAAPAAAVPDDRTAADDEAAAPVTATDCRAEPSVATGTVAAGRGSRALIKTAPLDPRDIRPSWPMAIASLERLSGWAVLALRLGTLALIQQCVRELAQRDARADLVVDLRALTEALAHMPLEV